MPPEQGFPAVEPGVLSFFSTASYRFNLPVRQQKKASLNSWLVAFNIIPTDPCEPLPQSF